MNVILIAGLGVASTLDLKFHKIPNGLTFSLGLMGLIFQIHQHGIAQGLTQGVSGMAVGILLLYLPFLSGGVGGGDVKLMGALGAFVGPWVAVKVFLASALFGGIFSIYKIVREGNFRKTIKQLESQLIYIFLTKQLPRERKIYPAQTSSIPFAVPICCGYLSIFFLGGG